MKKPHYVLFGVFAALTMLMFSLSLPVMAAPPPPAVQIQLPGTSIPQFVDRLPSIDTIVAGSGQIQLNMTEFKTNILPNNFVLPNGVPYAGTYVWGYLQNGETTRQSYIGPVIVAQRGVPTEIKYVNNLGTVASTNILAYKNSTDQTLHWADPLNGEMNQGAMTSVVGKTPLTPWNLNYNGPIPATVHLHGGEVPPELDGGPDSWFTSDGNYTGHSYYSQDNLNPKNYAIYTYPNNQEAAPLWFHDHTLGATRLNVYAGLAGGYLLTDPALRLPAGLGQLGLQRTVSSPDDSIVPLVIQDRMFDTKGQLFFPNVGINPEHPYWVPEFLGDVIVVNGKAWPYLDVKPQRYRFLFLNGSNARSYEMSFQISGKGKSPTFWQVGTDGGYLDAPVAIQKLVLMPGERADVIIDFAGFAPGTTMILQNTAKAPYPGGAPPQGTTVGRIMQFRVGAASTTPDDSYNPALGTAIRTATPTTQTIERLVNPTTGTLAVSADKTRQLTLNEILDPRAKVGGVQYPGGPTEILVNNTKWSGNSSRTYNDFTSITVNGITTKYSELPVEGDTEVWEFVNLTADAHPMHLHLVQFQLINRQSFDLKNYTAAYNLAFPGGGLDPVTGLPYPAGVYMPAFGPPLNYNTGNARALGGNPDISPFLLGAALTPAVNEAGWKDTIMVPPGMVTRIAVRWAPTDKPTTSSTKANLYFPFDPSDGLQHGYVWHCHIIDHEDNEMMRPDVVQLNPLAPAPGSRPLIKGTNY